MDFETIKELMGTSGVTLALALLLIGRLFAGYVKRHFFDKYLRLKEQELEERKLSRSAVLSVSRGLHRVGGALEHGQISYRPRVVRDTERHGAGESETDRVFKKEAR